MSHGSQDTPDPEGTRENGMIVGFFPATSMPDADWWQALWPDPPKILLEMGVESGAVAIDLCCGDGLFTGAACSCGEARLRGRHQRGNA